MTVSIVHEIPFHDVDSMGIVWHGHYYKYFELARTALYRSLSLDVAQINQMGYRVPVIESNCRYFKPLLYGQRCQITAQLKAWEHYLLVAYTIESASAQDRFASGYTKQAVCDQDGELHLHVPDLIIAAISQYKK